MEPHIAEKLASSSSGLHLIMLKHDMVDGDAICLIGDVGQVLLKVELFEMKLPCFPVRARDRKSYFNRKQLCAHGKF